MQSVAEPVAAAVVDAVAEPPPELADAGALVVADPVEVAVLLDCAELDGLLLHAVIVSATRPDVQLSNRKPSDGKP